jgi:hypothetical protein
MTTDRNRLGLHFLTRPLSWPIGLSACLLLLFAGCTSGPPRFIIKGKVIDGAKEVKPDPNSSIHMQWVQQVDEGKAAQNYSTMLNPDDGSFEMNGNEDGGVIPAKYRVKFTSLSPKPSPLINFLNNRFGQDTSPIFIDIVDDKNPVVIDIATHRKR